MAEKADLARRAGRRERKNLLHRNPEACRESAGAGVTVYPPQKDVFNAFRLPN